MRNLTHAAADGEGHKDLFRDVPHRLQDRIPPLMRGGDIQETQLIRALVVIDLRLLHRVTGVNNINEIHALHNAAIVNIQAGDDTGFEHPRTLTDQPSEIKPQRLHFYFA